MHDHDGKKLARWTGLEPATPGVTGRYSNQLSYHRALRGQIRGHTGGVKREKQSFRAQTAGGVKSRGLPARPVGYRTSRRQETGTTPRRISLNES